MDFEFSDEQKMFAETVFRFATNELLPHCHAYEEKGAFAWDNWRRMGEYGLFGLPFPAEYGGAGADCVTTCLAMEAVARAGIDGGTSLAQGAHMILCGVPIWKMGTEAQKRKYLPNISTGEWIGGFGLTEPGAGSDATAMSTTAVKKGDAYILNGSKMFITNGPVGHQFVVMASTDRRKKAFGISAFIVESAFPGFSVGKELDKLGMRTSTTSELIFEDCVVPAENLLGEEDCGFVEVGRLILGWERSSLMAPAVGGMEAGLNHCLRYAKEREQFRRPIASFQAIKHMLADMKVRLEVSRQLVYTMAWMIDTDQPMFTEAAITKAYVTEAAMRSAEEAVQIFGGYGYMKEYVVERGFRDAKIGTIGAGTSEIQRSIIARSLMNLGY